MNGKVNPCMSLEMAKRQMTEVSQSETNRHE